MKNRTGRVMLVAPLATGAVAMLLPGVTVSQTHNPPNFVDSPNGEGISRTLTVNRGFDTSNPFFKPLGTNGRTCATCHPVNQGMTITPDYAQQVFAATNGTDPLFLPVDGANSPKADMSTVQSRLANCSMLLNKGLIRVGLPIPANAEFSLAAVDDPYHYANASDISCFRRPLPATNLRFLSNVMWDGRELAATGNVADALRHQVMDAVLGHEQAKSAPSANDISAIVDFETHLYTSQVFDNDAGDLDGPQTGAGPEMLINLPFMQGINNPFAPIGGQPPFNQNVFDFYNVWAAPPAGVRPPGNLPIPTAAQQSVARGQRIFNTRQFAISGVAGLNDVLNKPTIMGTCSTCHNTPRVGSNSVAQLMNTGVADGALRTPDLPLYTLKNKKTGAIVKTTDPGAALTTGKWADIGKFKAPSLRGLETQSPYMHNGFSGDLLDIIEFYDTRFHIGLSIQDEEDLRAFLKTL